jgi:hypothetical protein
MGMPVDFPAKWRVVYARINTKSLAESATRQIGPRSGRQQGPRGRSGPLGQKRQLPKNGPMGPGPFKFKLPTVESGGAWSGGPMMGLSFGPGAPHKEAPGPTRSPGCSQFRDLRSRPGDADSGFRRPGYGTFLGVTGNLNKESRVHTNLECGSLAGTRGRQCRILCHSGDCRVNRGW